MLESLEKHCLASTAISLNMLKLIRIACSGMILDANGKLKIFENAGIENTVFILQKLVVLVDKSV
jgi:Kinetochore complex Sim4 subunit Fta1